ncbi:unnamed protein product [Angiostrongylus costaricensis]|uniref:KRR-R motif-containing protein 1 n=1 Tax=Angiostrongylus costaricensis TaxID=334426 RepID=A0A158PIX7_ANGCS|nr:unnamed protein product [Angiostrongylus costaricensis]
MKVIFDGLCRDDDGLLHVMKAKPVVVNECRPTEKLFGITRRLVEELSQKDIDCLYRQLRVTKESHNVRVVFVKGTDDMTRYDVEKIFAEYHPCRVEIIDKTSCLMSFASRADCVRMMIGMTKPLRRFRATREAEDGELTDSDGEEEEGQIKLEKGDDVALVAHAGAPQCRTECATSVVAHDINNPLPAIRDTVNCLPLDLYWDGIAVALGTHIS